MEAPGQATLKQLLGSRERRAPIDVRLFSDEPIADEKADFFGFAAFAKALAEIVDNEETGTPLTIALSAPWGAGKTSVARMIETDLRRRVVERKGEGRRIICEFNAWEHDDAPHLGAALAARVAKEANRRRPAWRRLWEPLPATMLEPKERWWRVFGLAMVAAFLAAALTAFAPTRHLATDVLKPNEAAVGAFGLIWLGALIWGVVFKAGRNASRFIDDPGSEAARGSIAEVKRQLGRLIAQATRRDGRMVIVVDDLERCRAARAVEVFEVASQLLSHPGVVTILLADMRSLAEAARVAYGEESAKDDPDMGRRYLEKLVQLELHLPPPDTGDMRNLLAGRQPDRAEGSDRDGKPEADAEGDPGSADAEEVEATWAVWGGLLGLLAGLALAIAQGRGAGNATVVALGAGFGGYLLGAFLRGILIVFEQRRGRDVAARVQATLKEKPQAASVREDEDALLAEVQVEAGYEALAQQVVESRRTVESTELKEVEAIIGRFPPRFPRGAKRMLNHARLLTKIARDRKMFDDNLTPEHLGKWIVIGERWPDFAARVTESPATLREVESPGAVDFPSPHLPTDDSGERDKDFGRLLKTGPKLDGVIARLIYFRPAPPTATPPASRSADEPASAPG